MKISLAFIFLILGSSSQSQSINIPKGHETISLTNVDSIYTLPFDVKGIHINSVPKISISGSSNGTAINDIDYAVLDKDSVKTETVITNAKNNSGQVLLLIRADITEIKIIVLNFIITDGKNSTTVSVPISVKPYTKPEKPKEPEKKDSLVIELYNDLDIPVHDRKHDNPGNSKQNKNGSKFKDVINIEKVSIDQDQTGKLFITIYTTENEKYFSPSGFQFSGEFSKDDKVYLNGDQAQASVNVTDFIRTDIQKKGAPSKFVTPQNRILKLEVFPKS